ncbi:MAG: hypothetical protein KC563_03125 [Nitrospira sp.]|nr:hypothetical protein [Nitrospira sp.]MCA9474789.1 hypothetical protein [Nitrospira sp.]MCA9478967.1 hypothetical protein [Nitrospira sp.]
MIPPVSGGDVGARNDSLSIMVGGASTSLGNPCSSSRRRTT